MAKLQKPHIATLDEVSITREGDIAIIEYHAGNVCTTHLKLKSGHKKLTDQEILDHHNDCIKIQLILSRECSYAAIEIPVGKPQIEYLIPGNEWLPRGDVLRCYIDSEDNETKIVIDDKEFTMKEFGKLINCFEGFGMRVTFVEENDIDSPPSIEIREPEDNRLGSIHVSSDAMSRTVH